MKTVAFTLLALGLALAAFPALAQGQTSYTLLSAAGNTWTAEGASGTNPTLDVPASTEITVIAKNADGGVHNLKVGDGATQDIFEEGAEVTTTFTSPASGTVTYTCTIHPTTMTGQFRVADATTNGGSEENNDSPGIGLLGVALAGIAAATILRRK